MTGRRPQASRVVGLGRPVPLSAILGHHRRGPADPTHRRIGTGWLRASRTPEGPVLLKLAPLADGVRADAWGPGAEWAIDQVPRLVGADDDPSGFVPRPEHPPLVEALRRFGSYRVGATDLVLEALAPACLEQVVTGKEAFRAFRLLTAEYGEPAPGPTDDPGSAAFGMRLPPTAEVWARVPSWKFLAAGVEQRRSRTLVRAATRATALERTLGRDSAAVDAALRSLPGIGPWTSAEVRQRAHGDADAWSIGDYHVGKGITWALTGEALDDDACTEVLEPYRGHRFRVQQLLALMGLRPPRRAPRMTLPTHTPYATRGRS
ncbi:3-methyladenine DNA glycosylase/8-oxoguanine DNA glycosylase [Friedmanniella endophytica]|uniref:3-methyladenine DNA glycosylase/8-oxoguanine DNA glycosylase n=1 Tax=Microlunatus kandeliicorticis TaxID=1759536 RepID=A0A7W3IQT6_9ACTN|nr:DNA-3-methyladenine glycosylase 2 family protein [Microlunatus kandeliicorticis]MBA8793533.1 3-methyladenine DNA glycosylase/8-oxoguanine DNA glycosylase [Microlunatus kandeliicorticis]